MIYRENVEIQISYFLKDENSHSMNARVFND